MNRFLLTLLIVCTSCLLMQAQQITVVSLSKSTSDMTAYLRPRHDVNDEACAVLKIQLAVDNVRFSGNVVGPVAQEADEYLLYMTSGSKSLTIRHPQYQPLTIRFADYQIAGLESSCTYRLRLQTDPVSGDSTVTMLPVGPLQKEKTNRTVMTEPTVQASSGTDAVKDQFLLFRVSPANATVIVNDEIWTTNDGVARRYVPFGTYEYRIMAQDHHTKTGKVEVNNPRQKQVVNIELQPKYAQVTITVNKQAEIWINGELKGEGSWTGNLGVGEYNMEARLAGHRPSSTHRQITLEPQNQTITLATPTPIFGKLMVSTLPDLAEVYIDDQRVGETPLMLHKVLVGEHRLTIQKAGYEPRTFYVTVDESRTETVEGQLEKDYNYSEASSLWASHDYAIADSLASAASPVVFDDIPIGTDESSANDPMPAYQRYETESSAERIYYAVEDEPEFPGGTKALMDFVSQNLIYPTYAANEGIQGRVSLSFVVERDGTITNIEVMRSPSYQLSEEAVRIVKAMPRWHPGRNHGEAVRVKYLMPVTFRL